MSIRRAMNRQCHRLAAILAILVCAAAIASHHSAVGLGDMHHEQGMSSTVEMCLAALTAVGVVVVGVGLGTIVLGRRRPLLLLAPGAVALTSRHPLPRARAGPSLLCLLCVSRR